MFNSFIEISLTYQVIHPFKMYNSTVFSIFRLTQSILEYHHTICGTIDILKTEKAISWEDDDLINYN